MKVKDLKEHKYFRLITKNDKLYVFTNEGFYELLYEKYINIADLEIKKDEYVSDYFEITVITFNFETFCETIFNSLHAIKLALLFPKVVENLKI